MYPQSSCTFKNNNLDDSEEEKKNIEKIPFVSDLTRGNMYSKSAPPFFIFPFSEENLFDLLFDRISVILHLDMNKFFELCSLNGLEVGWSSTKESEKLKQEIGKEALIHNKTALWRKSKKGDKKFILRGSFSKIFHDLLKPTEIIRLWKFQEGEHS